MNKLQATVGALAIAGGLAAVFEGYRAYGYDDGGGVPTACYGHTGPEVEIGRRYSKEQCDLWFRQDMQAAAGTIIRLVKVPLTDDQSGALIDFAYNVGHGQFATSTLLKKLNAGNYDGAADELLKWVYDNGEIRPGLVKRRKAERMIWHGDWADAMKTCPELIPFYEWFVNQQRGA